VSSINLLPASQPGDTGAAGLQRRPAIAYWLIVLVGVVVTVAALPSAIGQISSAPAEFWVLAALALVADIRPILLPAPARSWATFVASVCFCFAILLLYGAAAAIVVQVLAVPLAARRLHLNWGAAAFLAARLVCSLAAAGLTARLLGLTPAASRQLHAIDAIGDAILVTLVFVAVSCAINTGRAWSSGATRSEIVAQLRFEVLARGSSLVLGIVLATAPGVWSLALVFVPLLGWLQLTRALADRDTRLEHDPVTGLLSRHGLDVALLSRPRPHRHDPDDYAVVLIQFGGIGYIGRNFGRDAVEHMLVAAARRLQGVTQPGDLIGRLSDSQMVVVLPSQSGEGAESAARRIVGKLSAPVDLIEGVPLRLDPLAGVAVAHQHGHDLADLIPHAETALFDAAARQEAVARVYAPETQPDVDDRLTLLQRLSGALNDPARASEIQMLFQPQVSIRTGRVDSVEALLRWTDPGVGLVPTDELFQAVEPTGVMQQLTLLVLDRVVRQLAEWNRAGIRLRAAANVSVFDLVAEGFDAQVRDVLGRYQVSPRQLDIEVTERSMVEDTVMLDEAAQRVTKLGVGLSLDDFGTGFASVSRLRRLPLTEVKIDRLYVSKIADSAADRAIVTAIHDLAHALGLRTVAEGVEDEATVDILATYDRVIAQGWYYARPMQAPDLVDWLRHRAGSGVEAEAQPVQGAQP
jgi:diguanylate cyclase (GGDEF)-like protein